MRAIEEGLEMTGLQGAVVELTVPLGREIAILTLNPKLGVAGGISILGSTGFVEPWNDHLLQSRNEEIKGLQKGLGNHWKDRPQVQPGSLPRSPGRPPWQPS